MINLYEKLFLFDNDVQLNICCGKPFLNSYFSKEECTTDDVKNLNVVHNIKIFLHIKHPVDNKLWVVVHKQ